MSAFSVVVTEFPNTLQTTEDKLKYIQTLEEAEYEMLKSPIESPEDNDKDNPTWRMGVPPALLSFYTELTKSFPDRGLISEEDGLAYFRYTVFEKYITITPKGDMPLAFEQLPQNIQQTIQKAASQFNLDLWVHNGSGFVPMAKVA